VIQALGSEGAGNQTSSRDAPGVILLEKSGAQGRKHASGKIIFDNDLLIWDIMLLIINKRITNDL